MTDTRIEDISLEEHIERKKQQVRDKIKEIDDLFEILLGEESDDV